jgi:hypothetical protein
MIPRGRQANVTSKFDFVSKTPNKRNDRARHICVDQKKAHAVLSGGKWVKGLLLGQLADESERRSNIVSSQIVLVLNFFKGHAVGEAPDHDRHRNTPATNDEFPVANSRINNVAILRLHGDLNITAFAQLVEITLPRSSPLGPRSITPLDAVALSNHFLVRVMPPISRSMSPTRRWDGLYAVLRLG